MKRGILSALILDMIWYHHIDTLGQYYDRFLYLSVYFSHKDRGVCRQLITVTRNTKYRVRLAEGK